SSIVTAKNALLQGMSHHLPAESVPAALDAAEITAKAQSWGEQLRPLIGDTTGRLLDELDNGKRLLMEGAQGSLLDIDHGTYPFVTSSNSSGVGISSGSGIPGKWIRHVIGVAKAY